MQKLASIMVLGLKSVGKSSIIRRILNKEFNPNIKPTLGLQIFNYAMENTKLHIYDLGGQDKLREKWFDDKIKPDGIIYVVDCSVSDEINMKSKEEFDRIIDFYGSDSHIDIPILILGNKIDVVKEYEYILINIFYNIKGKMKYNFGYCSALENIGILDNFMWLLGEMVKIT